MLDLKPEIQQIQDKAAQNAIQDIFNQAFGEPIEFSGIPTLEDMKSNTWGFYLNDIYIKTKTGKGIKLSGAAFT